MNDMGVLLGIARKYHRDIDDAVAGAAGELARAGLVIPCEKGCSWCCRLPVRATAPEAALVAAYLIENLPKSELIALKARMECWLDLARRDEEARDAWGFRKVGPPAEELPQCPLLSSDLCIVYPVRPMGCRVHATALTAEHCRSVVQPGADREPDLVAEILMAAKPLCMEYRSSLERMGVGFEGAVDLLPALVLPQILG